MNNTLEQRYATLRTIVPLLDLLQVHNISQEYFFTKADVPRDTLLNLDKNVAFTKILAWADCARKEINDAAIGLHAGELMHSGYLGELGIAMLSCNIMAEAALLFMEYFTLNGNASESLIVQDGDHLVYTEDFGDVDPEIVKPFAEQFLTSCLIFSKSLLAEAERKKFQPIEVSFKHAKPHYSSEYSRIFQCPVYFQQERNAIVLPTHVFDLPVVGASPELKEAIEKRLHQAKHELFNRKFYYRVKGLIEKNFEAELPSIEETANHFYMSKKTLQRRLRDEGATYRELCLDIRQTRAYQWVTTSNKSIQDIANTLGYSHISAFSRAFKEWFGVSPRSFRENQD